jgi:hypothetical protein
MDNRFAFKITDFDYTQGGITFPQFSCWYRAYNPQQIILGNLPTFFGDIEVAYFNLQQTGKVYCF